MRNLDIGLSKARAGAALRAVDLAVTPEHAISPVPVDGAAVVLPEPKPLDIDRLQLVELDPDVLSNNRIVTDELSGASAAYKMLRTRVLQRMRRNNWKTIAVTGTCPEEGKSLTAINLAINLARDVGTTAVLVDMDLRKPSINRHLGISWRYGIGDFLRGSVPLQKVAVNPGIDRLAVVLGERPFQNSSEMISSPRTAELVEQVKQGEGRIAVFDMPPVLASDDMIAFAPLVDAVLLVIAQGKTQQADLAPARDLLQNMNVVGVVLNQCADQVAPYYYYGRR
jgi:capsular exopolysaccharide synthesis family protein